MKVLQIQKHNEQKKQENAKFKMKTLTNFYKPSLNHQNPIQQKRKLSTQYKKIDRNQSNTKIDQTKKMSLQQSPTKFIYSKSQSLIKKNTLSKDKQHQYHSKKELTSQNIFSQKIAKKFSTYALSTMSSFAKTFNLKQIQNKTIRKNQKTSKNISLKPNPQRQLATSIQNKVSNASTTKRQISIQKFKNQLIKLNTIEATLNQKLLTEGSQVWDKKYLKKRISSFSKISSKIVEMNSIFINTQNRSSQKFKPQFNTLPEQFAQNNMIQKINQKHPHKHKQQCFNCQKHTKNKETTNFKQNDLRSKSVQQLIFTSQYPKNQNFRSTKIIKNNQTTSPQTKTNQQPFQSDGFHTFRIEKTEKKQQTINQINSTQNNKQLNTSIQKLQQKYHKPLKLHTQTVYTHYRKHKSKSINTLSEFQHSLIEGKKKNDLQKSLIQQIRKKRTSENLQKQPKQWHFYNFWNLNKIQLYETNLRISSQNWTAIDYLELKYLRGFNAKILKDYSLIGMRLFLFKCFQKIVSQHKLDLSQVRLRTNYKNIKHRVQLVEYRKNKKSQDQEQGYTLRNHTIITVQSLLIGICRVIKCQDLIMHLIYVVGYLIMYFNEHKQKGNQFIYDQVIFFRQNSHLHQYISNFINKSNQIIEQIHLQSMRIVEKHNCILNVISNSLDISTLFMSSMTFQLFEKICLGKISNDVKIKYQVGWNHWQDRNHYFMNEFNALQRLGLFGFKDQFLIDTSIERVKQAKQENLLVYDCRKKIIIVIGSAKVNMGINDLKEVEKWIMKTFKRFYKEHKQQYKLCQLISNKSITQQSDKSREK